MIRTTLLPRLNEINEHRLALLLTQADRQLTPRENARLDYYSWQIEQIEESLVGDQWDLIEAAVAQQLSLGDDMRRFIEQLKRRRRRLSENGEQKPMTTYLVVRAVLSPGLPYQSYREPLRQDFCFSCAYCTMAELGGDEDWL